MSEPGFVECNKFLLNRYRETLLERRNIFGYEKLLAVHCIQYFEFLHGHFLCSDQGEALLFSHLGHERENRFEELLGNVLQGSCLLYFVQELADEHDQHAAQGRRLDAELETE